LLTGGFTLNINDGLVATAKPVFAVVAAGFDFTMVTALFITVTVGFCVILAVVEDIIVVKDILVVEFDGFSVIAVGA
jgi:hypothetical protein